MVEVLGGPRLWYVNTDFEAELAAMAHGRHHTPKGRFTSRNLIVAYNLLKYWLRPGDALLTPRAWRPCLETQAAASGVDLVSLDRPGDQSGRLFTPWGWTPTALAVGARTGAALSPPPLEIVARVNSKVFSHELERELGVADARAKLVASEAELTAHVARACPHGDHLWVVKHPYGVAARERVLGRGPTIPPAAAIWCRRRFADGDILLFEPWHAAVREYGVCGFIDDAGNTTLLGVSRPITNKAGVLVEYDLTPTPIPESVRWIGEQVGTRLAAEGYRGPWGCDTLEHTHGQRLLLEINARWTVGFLTLRVAAQSPPRRGRWRPETPPPA
ncbi:MAG: hypothetical protein NZ585_10885 [Chloracidobacterium sp.]|nr:hypothetical protein [Chloracidobacterium sp.]MDW8217718.1 hypothetical protein [Acidobacteriota bacterium]